MSNNPEVKTPFSEHDLDLVYRFHIGEIDMPELQSRLEFWRPAPGVQGPWRQGDLAATLPWYAPWAVPQHKEWYVR